jgi:hypothetical protein
MLVLRGVLLPHTDHRVDSMLRTRQAPARCRRCVDVYIFGLCGINIHSTALISLYITSSKSPQGSSCSVLEASASGRRKHQTMRTRPQPLRRSTTNTTHAEHRATRHLHAKEILGAGSRTISECPTTFAALFEHALTDLQAWSLICCFARDIRSVLLRLEGQVEFLHFPPLTPPTPTRPTHQPHRNSSTPSLALSFPTSYCRAPRPHLCLRNPKLSLRVILAVLPQARLHTMADNSTPAAQTERTTVSAEPTRSAEPAADSAPQEVAVATGGDVTKPAAPAVGK